LVTARNPARTSVRPGRLIGVHVRRHPPPRHCTQVDEIVIVFGFVWPDLDMFRFARSPLLWVDQSTIMSKWSTSMTTDIVKTPGPDHAIEIAPSKDRIVVRFAGQIVADTRAALVMREAGYAPTYYVPIEHLQPDLLESSTHTTYCPYKGHCSYYTLAHDRTRAENAVWFYKAPHPAVAEIKGHAAFYVDKVELTVG
jgi:uncharacterized protein (DUF427 family)